MKCGVLSEAETPTKKQKKVKKQNEVNTSEVEAAATGKGSSEEEYRKVLEGNVTLLSILSAMDNMSTKFDHIDSWFNAYELDRNRPLVDQKTIDDMVKASVEERLKVLGVGKSPEKNDKLSIVGEEQSLSSPSPQQKSVNSLALAKTPDLVFARKRNLAKELDKDTGVKRTLAEEFGSGAAKPAKASEHDFIYVSLAKATKPTKATRAYGRGWRGKHIVKDEYTADKKKAEQAEASLEKKEKADARKKQAELKKQQAEDDSDVEHVTDEARAEENEVLTESDVDSQELIISAVVIPPKPPAPENKKVRRSADHESDFYSILIHERPWPDPEYGWVFDNVSLYYG
ncbi:hypothetical protein Bca4012_025790 [Brassica carinata]